MVGADMAAPHDRNADVSDAGGKADRLRVMEYDEVARAEPVDQLRGVGSDDFGPVPRIAVVIPAWNEEGSIGRVIDDLPKPYVDRVIVADNNSTDYTASVARKFGATVVAAARQGYGSGSDRALSRGQRCARAGPGGAR